VLVAARRAGHNEANIATPFQEEPMKGLHLEEAAGVSECYAVVYAPGKHRKRFPENCVYVKQSEAQARAESDPAHGKYAALVIGPSRSSEGFRLYYLKGWLD
jgi:hypothetical protein